MRSFVFVLFLTFVFLAMTACGAPNMVLDPSLTPTITLPPPTSTPKPSATSTPFPTKTLQPSPTPTCPPRPDLDAQLESVQAETAALVPGAKVIWYDNFNCQNLEGYGWNVPHDNPTFKATVSNHILNIDTEEMEGNWNGIYWDSGNIKDNRGVLLLFEYEAGAMVHIFIETGVWQSTSFRRWSISLGDTNPLARWERWKGKYGTGYDIRNGLLRPKVWYYLLMQLGNQGEVTLRVWEQENPKNKTEFQKMADPDLAKRQWFFAIQVYEGTVDLKGYREFSVETP